MITVNIGKRDFSGGLLVGGLAWVVDRLNWRAVGGPWSAHLRAYSARVGELWNLAGLLRCPLTVTGETGPAWWGYISTVEIHDQGRVVRVSLDEMFNSVGAEYSDFSPTEPNGAGRRMVTAFVSDNQSILTYGTKERVFGMGAALPSDAAAYAATMLAQHKGPMVTYVSDQRSAASFQPEAYAVVECRGWWETLDWQFYSDSRGLSGQGLSGKEQPVGAAAANTRFAWHFPASGWSANEVWIRARKVGNPADGLKVELCADASGAPSAVIATQTLGAGSIGSEWDWVRFVFSAPGLLAGPDIWLVVSRSGGLDGGNYYSVSLNEADPLPGQNSLLWNGSAWVSLGTMDPAAYVVGVEETSLQISRLLASSAAQFLSGARVEVSSGVNARMWRDGSERARAVAESFLGVGTSAGRRLLARVEADRTARVFAQPDAAAAQLYLDAGGQVNHADGRALDLAEWPAGGWARVGELSAVGDLYGAAGLGAVFVEACTWTAAEGFKMVEV